MNIETCEALRIDAQGEISWAQLIELSGLAEGELRELVDDGALVPLAPEAPPWRFQASAMVVARTAGRLRRASSAATAPASNAITGAPHRPRVIAVTGGRRRTKLP